MYTVHNRQEIGEGQHYTLVLSEDELRLVAWAMAKMAKSRVMLREWCTPKPWNMRIPAPLTDELALWEELPK